MALLKQSRRSVQRDGLMLELHAHPAAIRPDYPTGSTAAFRQDELELRRDANDAVELQTGAACRQIADRAGNRPRAEKNAPGFQHPHSRRHAPFFHSRT